MLRVPMLSPGAMWPVRGRWWSDGGWSPSDGVVGDTDRAVGDRAVDHERAGGVGGEPVYVLVPPRTRVPEPPG
jgi:hypothetical protein